MDQTMNIRLASTLAVEDRGQVRLRRWLMLCWLTLFGAACSTTVEQVATDAAAKPDTELSRYDDDSDRLGHCEFEPVPKVAAKAAPQVSELQAGLGKALMRLPIGTTLGGWGDRLKLLGDAQPVDEREGRWSQIMLPSVGIHDVPRAAAIALKPGRETRGPRRAEA